MARYVFKITVSFVFLICLFKITVSGLECMISYNKLLDLAYYDLAMENSATQSIDLIGSNYNMHGGCVFN